MHVAPLFTLLPGEKHALIYVVRRSTKEKAVKATRDEAFENEARPCGYMVRTTLAQRVAR